MLVNNFEIFGHDFKFQNLHCQPEFSDLSHILMSLIFLISGLSVNFTSLVS